MGIIKRDASIPEMMEFWKSLGETTYMYDGVTYPSEKDFFKEGIAKIIDEEAEKAALASALTS